MWLNRQQISDLFSRDIKTISKHINNALREELEDEPVVAKFATTATDGKLYQVEFFNLDMILSVGSRVKSKQGVKFRKWANKILKQYLLKGYVINQRMIDIEKKVGEQGAAINNLVCLHNHDRFLIIDDVPYMFGASLKDAGKKLFAYIKMQETSSSEILRLIR
jgi:hypothetical protein